MPEEGIACVAVLLCVGSPYVNTVVVVCLWPTALCAYTHTLQSLLCKN